MTETAMASWIDHYPPGVDAGFDAGIARTLPEVLHRAVENFGGNVALSHDGAAWSYAVFDRLVSRAAAGLQALGLQPGDRVAVMMPNHPAVPVWYFGAVSAGLALVSINALYARPTVEHMLIDSGARTVLTVDSPETLGKLRLLMARGVLDRIVVAAADASDLDAPPDAADLSVPEPALSALLGNDGRYRRPAIDASTTLAVLQYTGGTTGLPKGAMLTHANLTANARQVRQWFTHFRDGAEKIFIPLPLSHITGISVMMTLSVTIAAELMLVTRFEPGQTLQLLRAARPGFFGGVPTIFIALLQSGQMQASDWESVHTILCGGAPLPPDVLASFERMSGVKVRQIYGATETAPAVTIMPALPDEPLHSVGMPIPGTRVAIRSTDDPSRAMPPGELGEICVSGPQVMRGYWKRDAETKDVFVDGHFRTGDIGRLDERGYLFVVDRLKDMIIAGGYNVYPVNVENAIYGHPAVAEAVVIGVPDAYRGETIKAFIVPKAGHTIDLDDLKAFLADRLSPIEMPRLLEVRSELPRTPVGKLSRLDLKRESRGEA